MLNDCFIIKYKKEIHAHQHLVRNVKRFMISLDEQFLLLVNKDGGVKIFFFNIQPDVPMGRMDIYSEFPDGIGDAQFVLNS